MAYIPEWEPLAAALGRLVGAGIEESQAKRDLCHAMADGGIRCRGAVARGNESPIAVPWRVSPPKHLRPEGIDWASSCPFTPWWARMPGHNQLQTSPPFNLVEVRREDVDGVLLGKPWDNDIEAVANAEQRGASWPEDVFAAKRVSEDRRRRRLENFGDRQRQTLEWINFGWIADWCARESGSIFPDEKRRAQAFDQLRDAILAGEFEIDGRSRVLLLSPDTNWAKLTRERLKQIQSIKGTYDNDKLHSCWLTWCWIPRLLAEGWFLARNLDLPRHLFPSSTLDAEQRQTIPQPARFGSFRLSGTDREGSTTREHCTITEAIAWLAYQDEAIAARYAEPLRAAKDQRRRRRQRDLLYPIKSGLPGTEGLRALADTALSEAIRFWEKADCARWRTAHDELLQALQRGAVRSYRAGAVSAAFWADRTLAQHERDGYRIDRDDLRVRIEGVLPTSGDHDPLAVGPIEARAESVTQKADPWADAVPRWVPLAKLPTIVERKFGIVWADTAQRLHDALEGFAIHTDIPDWPHGSGSQSSSLICAEDGRTAVSEKGWKSVDWQAGTLQDYPVLVLWPHVEQEIKTIQQAIPGKQPRAPQTPAPLPKLSSRPAHLGSVRPRGPRPRKRDLIVERMVADFAHDPDRLNDEKEEALASRYDASRDTVRRARQLALEQLNSDKLRQTATIDK